MAETLKKQVADQGQVLAVQTEILKRVEANVNQINEHIVGNGKTGILTRLDRLEQWKFVKDKVLWVVIGGAVIAIMEWAGNKL